MVEAQIILFTQATAVIPKLLSLTIDEQDIVEVINTLAEAKRYEEIDELFNDEDYTNADDLLDEIFCVDLEFVNEKASECGYHKVG